MSQVEVAELLGRHKSWVCRRLALIERAERQGARRPAGGAAVAHGGAGARQIVRLPQGNQAEVLDAARREALSSAELAAWWTCGWVAPITPSSDTFWRIHGKHSRKPNG
jgi:hypothetical protein